ncbi:hypothetical protein OZ671_00970 [Phreatobacter sp. AB_2022a]|nr:hypothetical protein [Phreatobacter sp. AB_2022a]MCZ0732796.1 hypothetical protein [Phreatobacter sp. AB_2022a]
MQCFRMAVPRPLPRWVLATSTMLIQAKPSNGSTAPVATSPSGAA